MTSETATSTALQISKRHKLRKWVLRIALILVILIPIIYMLAGLGSKAGLWSWQFGLGFMTRQLGVWVMMLTGVLGVIGLLLTAFVQPRKGWFVAALAILVPAAGLFHLKSVSKKVQALPFIHDITTDTQNPPTFTSAILDARAKTPGVNTVDYAGKRDVRKNELISVLQTKSYPRVRPLVLPDTPDVTFGEAKQAARQLGWKIVSESTDSGKIEATASTFWYGFKDDVVIRVRPSEGGGSIVDIRSVSRVGASDMGANAARIEAFLAAMSKD